MGQSCVSQWSASNQSGEVEREGGQHLHCLQHPKCVPITSTSRIAEVFVVLNA